MNAKTSSSLSNAAHEILNGNCEKALEALKPELNEANQTADAWLLQAWSSKTFSETEEALYRVLELDADNSVALNGLEWLSGVLEVATGLNTDAEGEESEDSTAAVAEEKEETVAEVAEEPVAEESTEEEPVAEETQEEVVAEEKEEAVAEVAEEPVAEETSEEEPAAEEAQEEVVAEEKEEAVAEVAEEPVAEESTEEEPAAEEAQEEVVAEEKEEAVAEVADEPVAEESTEEEPAAEEAQEEVVAEEKEETVTEILEEPAAEVATEEELVAEEADKTENSTPEFSAEDLEAITALEAEVQREEELSEAAAEQRAEEAAKLADEVAAAEEAAEAEAKEAAEAEAAAKEAAEAEAEAKRQQAELDRLNEEAEAIRLEEEKAAAEEAEAQQREEEHDARVAEAQAAAEAARLTVEQNANTNVELGVTKADVVEDNIQQDLAELTQDVQETLAPAEEVVATDEAEARPLVLAVDDSPTIRKLLTMTLERQGFDVISAADGVEALTVLSEQLPDVILSDINMPRLGGYQLCKFVKKYDRTKHIPVIMLSGKDGVFDKMRGKMAGCNDYIVKPFESNDLVSKVRQHAGVLA